MLKFSRPIDFNKFYEILCLTWAIVKHLWLFAYLFSKAFLTPLLKAFLLFEFDVTGYFVGTVINLALVRTVGVAKFIKMNKNIILFKS